VPLWLVGAAFWSLVLAIVVARAAGVPDQPAVATFGVVFASIVIEALPFILLGAAVSAALAVWVPDSAFGRIGRLPRALQVPGAALAGVAFPVCECGSIPVGRRLIARGLHPAAGVAFMFASPILNPIVLASTWVAYQGRGKALEMTAGRAGLGLLIAVAAALAISGRSAGKLLRERPAESEPEQHESAGPANLFVEHLTGDLLFMGRFLVLGAAVSAAVQTLVPQQFLSGLGGAPVLGSLAMMGMAFALSLCSEADAFVAVSFTAFPLGPQLAFLVLGPVLDAKLAVLYGATFRRGFVPRLVAIAVPVALVGSLVFGVAIK
jgi:uncharacterized membrane protein YraQ (UPF0718 family)